MKNRTPVAVPIVLFLAGCTGTGIAMPSYEPRPVAVPAACDSLIQRAAAQGVASLSEPDSRTVDFCQHQQLVRAAEEEAAARKLDAHARAAGLLLQVTTLVVGTTIAVLTWAF